MGSVPVRARTRSNQSMFFSHIDVSFPLFLLPFLFPFFSEKKKKGDLQTQTGERLGRKLKCWVVIEDQNELMFLRFTYRDTYKNSYRYICACVHKHTRVLSSSVPQGDLEAVTLSRNELTEGLDLGVFF